MRLDSPGGGTIIGDQIIPIDLAHAHWKEELTDQIDNVKLTFETSFPFIPGTLIVHYNGLLFTRDQDYVEESDDKSFTIMHSDVVANPPAVDCDKIFVEYHLAGVTGVIDSSLAIKNGLYILTASDCSSNCLDTSRTPDNGTDMTDLGQLGYDVGSDTKFRSKVLIYLDGGLLINQLAQVTDSSLVVDGDVARDIIDQSIIRFSPGLGVVPGNVIQILDLTGSAV